ncbi:hypothetical protein GCM10010448_65960 [Streptomyces glomeratus]|uniref:Uncharacterized protein n=1 Tax=Streptomyces glomeratus TaxID=284452 RepID=A0ABP6M5M4_9ACTN
MNMLVVSTNGRGVLAEHHPFEGNRDTYSGRYTASGAQKGREAVAADIRQQCPAGRPAHRGIAAAPRTTGALRGNGAYGAAKAALMAWNHTLAQQLGPHGATARSARGGCKRRGDRRGYRGLIPNAVTYTKGSMITRTGMKGGWAG